METSKDVNETVNSILNTYSLATITNYEKIVTSSGGKISVFVYLDKSEVVKLFEVRKKLVYDIYEKALQYEAGNNLGYALKSYYFAIVLMNSIPSNAIIYEGKNLITEIPFKINEILNKTKFVLKSDRKTADNERELIFKMSFLDKPVQLLEFTFWDGTNQVQVRGIDGECVVRLFGSSISFDKINIDIKYSYYESRDEIKEVGELWNLVEKPAFNFTKQIALGKTVPQKDELKENAEKQIVKNESANKKDLCIDKGSFKLDMSYVDSCKIVDKISEETLKFLEILKEDSVPQIEKYYSYDNFLKNKIINLVKYNCPSIVGNSINADINKTLMGWELRKIRVLNRYKSIKRQSTEYIILDFDEDGNLYDVTYGVLESFYDKVQEQSKYGKDWMNRQTIMKFVEKYRTSFLCRDISTIDSLFADEAVIIVGRILKKTSIKDGYKYLKISNEQPEASYIQYTKEQYLKNLAKLFKSTEDIFIGYSSMNIIRKNVEKVYGISMRQDYNSTKYSDEGYLFLLVDFEAKNPQIYVRTWQPKEWDEQSLIRLSNFNINR